MRACVISPRTSAQLPISTCAEKQRNPANGTKKDEREKKDNTSSRRPNPLTALDVFSKLLISYFVYLKDSPRFVWPPVFSLRVAVICPKRDCMFPTRKFLTAGSFFLYLKIIKARRHIIKPLRPRARWGYRNAIVIEKRLISSQFQGAGWFSQRVWLSKQFITPSDVSFCIVSKREPHQTGRKLIKHVCTQQSFQRKEN